LTSTNYEAEMRRWGQQQLFLLAGVKKFRASPTSLRSKLAAPNGDENSTEKMDGGRE
jgi:hypothetical protein